MSATTDKQFNSFFTKVGKFAEHVENDSIKNEPMFFNCDRAFAYANGGDITRSFLDNLPDSWDNFVFDSRVHMLMPGWFPAIPGYHHDDVPRELIPVGTHFINAGQPDYDNPRYLSDHICGLVNAEVSPTQWAIGECTMPSIPAGELIYRRWHNEVVDLLAAGKLTAKSSPDRTLIHFDCNAFHQGVKAVKAGWRWFGRVSRNTDRTRTITNEIRKQAQVYMEFPMEGW